MTRVRSRKVKTRCKNGPIEGLDDMKPLAKITVYIDAAENR
jgi:hypothetical protein